MIGESKDDVVGILLAKELLNYYANPEAFDAARHAAARRCSCPESKRLNVLLREFRANRNHIAIVVDEYGGVSGLVTIEDVLEQIVGDIEDEYDFDESRGQHHRRGERPLPREGADRDRRLQRALRQPSSPTTSSTPSAASSLQAFGRAAEARRDDDDRRLPLPRRARRQPAPAHAAGRARGERPPPPHGVMTSDASARPRRPRRRASARSALRWRRSPAR